jgi:hypothetical protein
MKAKKHGIHVYFMLAMGMGMLFHACEKDPLTLPAEVPVYFIMENELASNPGKGNPFLEIDSARISITDIRFDGDREQGEDIFFTAGFENNRVFKLNSSVDTPAVTFDIPQGKYKHMKFILEVGGENQHGISIQGKYKEPGRKGKNIPLHLNFFMAPEIIELLVESELNGQENTIQKDQEKKVEIILDLEYMFRLLQGNRLQQADTEYHEESERIHIAPGKNEDIYYDLANRVGKSFRAVYK